MKKLKFNRRVRFHCGLLAALLSLSAATQPGCAGEVWIQSDPSSGSPSGTGTQGDPFRIHPNTDLGATLAGTWSSIPTNTILHLSAGDFMADGIEFKAGWKFRGAGMGVTRV